VVLAVAGYFLLRESWNVAAMPAFRSDKLEQAAAPLLLELEDQPLRQWDETLAEASRRHGVTFFLYSTRGPRLAGPTDFLPGNVHSVAIVDRPERRGPPPRPRAFGDPVPQGGRPPHRRPHHLPEDEEPEEDDTAKEARVTGPQEKHPVILTPEGYWAYTTSRVHHPDYSGRVALLARSDSPTGHGFYSNRLPLYGVGLSLVFVSVLVWLPFVRSTTRSLKQMRAAAARISHGDFSTRVDVKRSDELGSLGRSVNHMADQIGGLVDGQKRLLGDIAHELSSPIARMQAVVGILENANAATDGRQERYIARLDDELQHMGQLVQELLSLSKASLKRTIELRPVSLEPLLRRVVEREQHQGEKAAVVVPPGLTVMSDPELLARAIGNVLRNALRYAGHAGPVRIAATSVDGEIVIGITDEGPGVPEAALPYLFDAFYRPDTARTRETGGSGLGLAIAKTCTDATGGTIRAANRPEGGLLVEITQMPA
jgi:two-component system sensor histidine kinase CpxA